MTACTTPSVATLASVDPAGRSFWRQLLARLLPPPAAPEPVGLHDLDARMRRDIGWCEETVPMPELGASVRRGLDFL